MKKNNILFISILLTVLLAIAGCTGDETSNSTKNTTVPVSFGSLNTNAPVETIQFGQLVGEWDCVSRDLDLSDKDNSKWYSNKATWKWEYILGGHAVLNKWWQEDTSPNPITKEYFASGIFIFNPNTTMWEAVIMNSRPHKISPKFKALYHDGKIEMNDDSGKWLVTFFDITDNSFEWKYEIYDGNEWKSISEIKATKKNTTL